MYRIHRESNRVIELEKRTFSELGFRERDHLQEWIAELPSVLGEDLLIIQKEFSGFSETQERLDLLALDKQGALVIIENKLDDSGRDVTWQSLKYASYCSNLSKEQVRDIYQSYLDISEPGIKASDRLIEFLGQSEYEDIQLNKGITQRIILIAAKFRKEVTSTVLWLMNFKLRVQCFRATPYSMGDELFLNIEQIIPTKDAEDYMIGMAEKAQDDIEAQTEMKHRHLVRRNFWIKLLSVMNAKSSLFQNISPGIAAWISAGSGVRGLAYTFVATKSYARVEVYIDRGEKAENMFAFEELNRARQEIESAFGSELIWEPLENRRGSRVKAEIHGNIYDDEEWDGMIRFMVDGMLRLEGALKGPLAKLNTQLRSWQPHEGGS